MLLIDLDTLYDNPTLFTYDLNTDWGGESTGLINKAQSKMNRLLGVRDESFDEQLREFAGLKRLDKLLGELLEVIKDKDNILLYSDNGSQIYRQENMTFSLEDSSATPEKIFQPALLVRAPMTDKKGRITSDTLINSCDLFATVAKLAGVDDMTLSRHSKQIPDFESILPEDLGGTQVRKKCISFGVSVHGRYLECIIRDREKIVSINQRPIAPFAESIDQYLHNLFPEIT